MDTELPLQRDAFNAFLNERFVLPQKDATLEEALAAFRAYERDRERLKQRLKPSIEQADRGEARTLDHDALMERVRARLDEHEIR